MDAQLLTYIGVVVLLIITPGADMALVTAVALRGGAPAGVWAGVGIATGSMVWAAASGIGLAALLAASAAAFTVVKLAGAGYLVFLGAQALWQARGRRTNASDPAPARETPAVSRLVAFRRGLLTNLLNPKVGIFYTALLPQFIGPGDPVLLTAVLLGGIHAGLGLVWLAGYAVVVGRAAAWLGRPGVRRVTERATGAVLIALGVRLAFQER